MTEHVCEWNFCAMDEWAWCECGKTLNFQEIEARLNEYETLKAATERLSAEDATILANWLTPVASQEIHDALRAYADILEGKDD